MYSEKGCMLWHSEFIHIVKQNGRTGQFSFKYLVLFAYALGCECFFQVAEAVGLQYSDYKHKLCTHIASVYIHSISVIH